MFYSASSTRSRFGRLDRAIARVLVAAILLMTPLSASAGEEFDDANNATFDNTVVSLDNSLAGQTNFTIDTDRTIIEWQDFQQPETNTLDFNFTNANASSSVLNRIGAQRASNVFGSITSNGQVILANPFGVYVRAGAIIDVGSLVAVGANISRDDFNDARSMVLPLTGLVAVESGGMIRADGNIALLGRGVINNGTIHSENGSVLAIAGQHLSVHDWEALTADFLAPKNFFGFLADGKIENNGTITAQNAAFFGANIANMGDIEIKDGTLLMVAADAVWVTEFDNPVLFKIPNNDPATAQANDSSADEVVYAIENHGRIDAGLGHVRLAASDPLGFAIRQGTGSAEAPAVIVAKTISLEGGETGRVHLSGEIDASDSSENGVGGEIDITGSLIVLEDANIHASGSTGGGTIHVGGEREGRGELQRAKLVLVDEDSEIRADALGVGDGGEVIVFAEDLTSVDGELSARGGDEGGNGGFVETSGLRRFLISRAPDVTARFGQAGEWLIDPFNITIDDTLPSADTNLNNAIAAILSPTFDSAGFDGILRTVNESTTDMNGTTANLVSAELIASALASGTSVTLSTQAFGLDRGTADGNISILADILIDSADTLEGTTATLSLLAAGDIIIESDIMAFMTVGDPTNLALTVELIANDVSQIESDQDFNASDLAGDVMLNADIRTGGGDVYLSGSSVIQASGQTIDTDGGQVEIRTGTLDRFGDAAIVTRSSTDDVVDPMTADPLLEIAGTIDTCVTDQCDVSETGGSVTLVASSINVRTVQGGLDPEQVVSGQLLVTGQILTGGGDIALSGGRQSAASGSAFTGNVDIDGDIDTRRRVYDGGGALIGFTEGGDVTIFSNHVDPSIASTSSVTVSFLKDPLGLGGIVEGGVIDIDADIRTSGGTISIGNERTRSIQLDGTFDTTQALDTTENGLFRLSAQDLGGVDIDDGKFGQGEIIIGAASGAPTNTTISTSNVLIESREVTFSDGAGSNAVRVVASGSSTATLPNISSQAVDETEPVVPPDPGAIIITGDRQMTFNANTSLTGESIEIIAAARPTDLNTTGASGDERANSETRLTFGGVGGADPTLGVRLNADSIMISVGDGTTTTSDGFIEDLGSSAVPTDFGLQRLTRASYDGLQLRDTAETDLPAELMISQDGDLTILSSAPSAPGELGLVGAFELANIGTDGMHITLESSDGRLTVEDAIGLNNDAGVMAGSDAGKSFVVLNGGLFLPVSPNEPVASDDSVRFRDGTSTLGTDGTTAFDVESLTVSSAGHLTVTQQIIDSIDPVNVPNELVFEAGRNTGATTSFGRGTLTVDGPGLTIQSGDRLALLAGATGFGDLIFNGLNTTLAADDVELRAGGGIDSQNTNSSDRSSISGLQSNVTIRDARFAALGNAAVFGDAASTATSFSYRQDAAIDGQADLPDLAQFGLTASGFRTAGDVEYSVRSDQGNIDLDDEIVGTNEGERFQNANLSLIGVDATSTPAIDVSTDFAFVGKRVELGGIGDFTFTQSLASAFNRSGLDADEEITLRSGVAGLGDLDFNRGSQSSVIVKAPRINLIAGDGVQVDDTGLLLGEAEINTRNAEFDLAGPAGSTPTFAFNTSSFLVLADLPDATQFMTEVTPGIFQQLLPDILAIRTDLGLLDLEGFDVNALPLDLVDDPGRLILEAEEIRLAQTTGANLDLTSNPNLNLRIRANELTLVASNDIIDLALDAAVLIGPRSTDNLQPNVALPDSSFDNESLLIEAFDRDARIPTVTNLSSLSEDAPGTGLYTLADGRGPTTISIQQDTAIVPDQLFDRDAVAGQLTRSFDDDEDGNPIPTIYSLTSVVNTVTFNPENVNGSSLLVSGITDANNENAIFFGLDDMPGVFFFENLFVSTVSSIFVQEGTVISANDTISLAAGQLEIVGSDPGDVFGSLRFIDDDMTTLTTRLEANKIVLTAGPAFKLEGPDEDADGNPVPVANDDLPVVDLTGLNEVSRVGDLEDSVFTITQSASLDYERGNSFDFLTPIEAGIAGGKWETLTLSVVQGDVLSLDDIDAIANIADNFGARTLDSDSEINVTVPDGLDPMIPVSPFDDFVGRVEFESNDILFQSDDPNTSIDLGSDNLTLVSSTITNVIVPEDELGRLRGDPDIDDRPIVRIHQQVDFTNSVLPQPTQYVEVNQFDVRSVRTDLSGLDIELVVEGVGTTLTLDDDIRSRVTMSNLILTSAADVDILLDGATPGFSGLDYADLQLTSLKITAGAGPTDSINIRPFMRDGAPADLTIETSGDQLFDGAIVLENTFSTRGRDIRFTGDIYQTNTPTAGLLVATAGKTVFEGNIGTLASVPMSGPLDRLLVTLDSDTTSGTPFVQFGSQSNTSPQTVEVTNNILFLSYDFDNGDLTSEIEDAITMAATLPELEAAFEDLEIGRTRAATVATIGKREGDLTFRTTDGSFVMGSGEKLSVGGTATIDVDNGLAALGDVSALILSVSADLIGLVRRASGVVLDRLGETQQDGGPSILANMLNFTDSSGMDLAPVQIGSGRSFRFGLPTPFDTASVPDTIGAFSLFEIKPSGASLTVEDFSFVTTTGDLADQIPSLRPTGASRSDLSGAFGPIFEPTPRPIIPEPNEPLDTEPLMELSVDATETPTRVRLARLEGAAIINDLGRSWDDDIAAVTTARIDAKDAEAAIALYEELFGDEGEHAGEIRAVLQDALDRYLENSRARRVVGFELRRFVKNRPSTLLDAYTTLESLDALFRYHRRLGLSAGEYRGIQKNWLRRIQPDGITLDELSEAIHPSRYVRGSDILDIFGR